jgi:hypothetical protein
MSQADFPLVFEQLKALLKPYASQLAVKTDTNNTYYLEGPYSQKWKKDLFFGSAQVKRNYVSYYLMPVYMYPELLKDISPELKKHMQGKSCFNFKKMDLTLFKELSDLTKKSYERLMEETQPRD